MKANLNNIKIAGVIGVIPSNISFYDDEIQNYSHDPESSKKLKKVMGYNQHRIVKNPSTISDMIIPAFQQALNDGQINIDEIDALILVTQTPDYSLPATSSYLHGKLNLKQSCYCIDINDGCTGYLKGLFECSSILRNSEAKKILLITGDVLSRKVSINDRNSYPLIGDGVCLTIVEQTVSKIDQPFELNFDGSGALALNIPAGGLREVPSDSSREMIADEEGNIRSRESLVMKGRDVFTFTQTVVIKFLSNFVKQHGLENADRFFLHQANKFILERIRKKLKIDQDILPSDVIEKYGNSSSASIPMSIVDKYSKSDLSNIFETTILSGFGVGLSWGAMGLRIDNLEFCDLIELDV